jgi:hypothetical protein
LQQDYSAARELYLESLELNAALGNASSVAMEQPNLGWVELHLGNVDEAEARSVSVTLEPALMPTATRGAT